QRHFEGSSPRSSRASFTASSKLVNNAASRSARAFSGPNQRAEGFFNASIVLSGERRSATSRQSASGMSRLKTAGVSFVNQISTRAAAAEFLPRLQSQVVSISTKGRNSGFEPFASRNTAVNSRAGNETSSYCNFSKSATSNLPFAEPNTSEIRQ